MVADAEDRHRRRLPSPHAPEPFRRPGARVVGSLLPEVGEFADEAWLNQPDGRLAACAPEEPVRRLTDLLNEFRPDTVLTFGPDGETFHPDHRTVSAWVRAACRRAGHGVRLLHAARTDSHLATWGPLYE